MLSPEINQKTLKNKSEKKVINGLWLKNSGRMVRNVVTERIH